MDPVDNTTIAPRLRFRQENEVKLNYSARITEVEWERHAEAVKYMHDQRKTRREILETLDTEYEFRPSMAQLNMHMRKRKLRVYGGGNAEPREVAEDEVLQAANAVAGANEPFSSTSLPAGQNDGALKLQNEGNLAADLTTRDAESLELPGGDQDRKHRFPDQGAQVSVTTPTDDVPDLSPLKINSILPDEVEVCENTTSLKPNTMFVPSPRGPFTNNPSPNSYRNISVCSFISHRSDRSSLKAFRRFAAEVARDKQTRREDSEISLRTPTIMSEDSWDFSLVTGMPSRSPSSFSRLPPDDTDWQAYRWIITNLYINQNRSLYDIRGYMQKFHDFHPR